MKESPLFQIPVDFGNCDPGGAVRLVTQGAIEALEAKKIQLVEGLDVILTDGELTATGTVTLRMGIWVAVISKWLTER